MRNGQKKLASATLTRRASRERPAGDAQHDLDDMKQTKKHETRGLEERIIRLERRLAALSRHPQAPLATPRLISHPSVPFALGTGVLAFGYLGLGLPQHYYQPLFAALVLTLAYHRSLWLLSPGHWRWPQVLVNFLMLCLFFKLLIGGGMRYPLAWLKVPVIKRVSPGEESPWYDQVIPRFDLDWQGIPAVSDVSFDITMLQTILLIATLGGALFRFQPFASLTAVVLLVVSIPTFMSFNWEWVVLFLVLGGISLYLQSEALTSPLDRSAQKGR